MLRAFFLLSLALSIPAGAFEITGVSVKRGGDGATRFDRIAPVITAEPLEKVEIRVTGFALSGEKETPTPLNLAKPLGATLASTDPKNRSVLTAEIDEPHSELGLTQLGLYKIYYVVDVRNPGNPESARSFSTPVVYLPVGVESPESVPGVPGIYPTEIRPEIPKETTKAMAFLDGKLVEQEIEVATIDPTDRGIMKLPPIGGGVGSEGLTDTEKLVQFAKILEAQAIRNEEARAAEAATYAKRAALEGKSEIYYFSNRPHLNVRSGKPWFDSYRYESTVNYVPCPKNYERFGKTSVYVPPSARPRGSKGLTGNPLNPWDNDNFAVLNENQPMTGYDFILELWTKPVLVYTHGFNTSFEEALIQAAQLKEDLGWPWAMVVLDWPSFGQSDVLSYKADRRMAELSAPQVANFMEALNMGSQASPQAFDKTKRGVRHYLNHSMGNYVFVKTVGELVTFGGVTSRLKPGFFNQVVFAAPDVEAKEFTDALTSMLTYKSADWTTLYYSRKDIAVNLSHIVNLLNTRVGISPIFFPGLTTVNADLVNSSLSSIAGFRHDYYGSASPMIFDLSLIFKYGMDANLRRPPLTEGTRVGMSSFYLYHVK